MLIVLIVCAVAGVILVICDIGLAVVACKCVR